MSNDALSSLIEERTKELNAVIVELQHNQEEVTGQLEKEREINKMKTRFVSMASHEFRSPLSSIQLSASLIERYYEKLDKEKVKSHLTKIKNAVNELTSTLDDFLSVERIEAGRTNPIMTEFDLASLAKEIASEMKLMAKQGQILTYTHSGLLTGVTLDKNLLKHCLVNLLSNAIKYSGEDGLIVFKTIINKNRCAIRIKDNGIGIPAGSAGHLFEAFYRSPNTGDIPGTGLGLNIVDRYTRLMGGTVKFSSMINEGSVFELNFPMIKTAEDHFSG